MRAKWRWQASVAAMIASGIAQRETAAPHTILTPAAG